jgi:hypothetical protein
MGENQVLMSRLKHRKVRVCQSRLVKPVLINAGDYGCGCDHDRGYGRDRVRED